ncbi:structural maintenance of chromosomes protein 2-1 [Phtheirospermum japonicum]|uniref:Structural maintenance of chromosomes protein 2-1 n=1 Tax=Phtheirospermum japonicum TaxID=374723 RepID=A0A830DHU0_9LAMI|nr:structural maintenance of chromosomes protein 2-1 [Phtheirospermum japonicum]
MLKPRNVTIVLSEQRHRDRRFPANCHRRAAVDATLDRSHTQNIGRMIKTHFSHSQEGMNNANVLFRKKFVDSVSTVQRTVAKQSKVIAITIIIWGEKAFCSSDCRYKQMRF